jgi:DNA-directed RNA polymerase subunit L/DNA-directed RNA polymerase alpha subunit
MSSKIDNFKEVDGTLTFTLSNVDVSYANAIRRTIISDIPVVVFKTAPHEENKCTIIANTSRLNNEIIKQRLGCIPICIQDLSIPFKNYLLEVDVENKTDTTLIVTTKDFKVKNLTTNTYLSEGDVRKIFPAYIPPTGKGEYFIDFLKLRPKITDEIPGEKIKLTCEFSLSTARNDSMFNVTGTCSYGCTPDEQKIQQELAIRKQQWKDQGKNDKEVKFESDNWLLLEAMRYVKKYSFDFIIQSIGIYDNVDIVAKSCNILIDKYNKLLSIVETDEITIEPSHTTLENCYDVILENEDYTLGNILNYEIYSVFYIDLKQVTYIGFKKMHPHDNHSVLRIAFSRQDDGKSSVKIILIQTIKKIITNIKKVHSWFDDKIRK